MFSGTASAFSHILGINPIGLTHELGAPEEKHLNQFVSPIKKLLRQ